MNVLSLFDGLSGGLIALTEAGLKVDKYFASEIDKYAIQVSKNNWEDVIYVGDVCKVKYEDGKLITEDGSSYEVNIDIVIGGSPCTTVSVAGNGSGFDGQSGLFYEYVRLLREINPKFFFLENVKMKKEWEDVITTELNVPPIVINSSLVSAQNRTRLYWTNIPNIEQPKDLGIVLEDILEPFVESKLTPKRPAVLREQYSLTSNGLLHIAEATDIKGNDSIKRVYDPSGKCPTLTTMTGGHREPKVSVTNLSTTSKDKAYALTASYSGAVAWNSIERKQRTMVAVGYVTNQDELADDPNTYENVYYRKLTPIECERLQTLPSSSEVFKLSMNTFNSAADANSFLLAVEKKFPKLYKESNGVFKSHLISSLNEAFSLSVSSDVCLGILEDTLDFNFNFDLNNLDKIESISLSKNKEQKITLLCLLARYIISNNAQTISSNTLYISLTNGYTYGTSNSQRYKQIGNGWTIKVISHIFKNIDLNYNLSFQNTYKIGDVYTEGKYSYTVCKTFLNSTIEIQRFTPANKLIKKVVNVL